MKLQMLERKFIGKEIEIMLISVENDEVYQVSICIERLEKPYYGNQLYKIFEDRLEAQDFYNKICEMREQDE